MNLTLLPNICSIRKVNHGYHIPATNLSHKGGLASQWIYAFIMAKPGQRWQHTHSLCALIERLGGGWLQHDSWSLIHRWIMRNWHTDLQPVSVNTMCMVNQLVTILFLHARRRFVCCHQGISNPYNELNCVLFATTQRVLKLTVVISPSCHHERYILWKIMIIIIVITITITITITDSNNTNTNNNNNNNNNNYTTTITTTTTTNDNNNIVIQL